MKKLMMIPLAVAMLFALGNQSRAGLFDSVFDVFEQPGKHVHSSRAPRKAKARLSAEFSPLRFEPIELGFERVTKTR